MPILRLSRLLIVALFAAGALAACKGSSSSSSPSGPTAMLRIVQGNPALQTVDYKVDSSGSLITGATGGSIQPYLTVTAATHTVYFYESGTSGNVAVTSPGNCPLPALATGAHYTLVIVAIGAGGTSTTPCVLYTEPSVAASAGQGIVVYHNVAGNATVVDANGNVTPNLYPVFCQPVGTIAATGNQPCASPAVQPGGPIVNGAVGGATSPTAVQVPVTYSTATSGPGVAFSVTNSPTGAPLCQGLTSDPTLYPKNVDSTDGPNFVPNGASDQVLSIFVTDSVSATSGANACPVTISGSTVI